MGKDLYSCCYNHPTRKQLFAVFELELISVRSGLDSQDFPSLG